MARPAAALPALSACLAACAQAPGTAPASGLASGGECFHAGQVNDFTPRGNDVVDVRVGSRRHYRLQLAGSCPDVNWGTRAVALRTLGGSSWICQGLDAELLVPSPLGTQRCLVRSVRRLSDAEVEALR